MKFVDVVEDIITGLKSGRYEAWVDEPDWAKGDESYQDAVNEIGELLDKHGEDVLLATKHYIFISSAHVWVSETGNFIEEHYQTDSSSVEGALKEYATSLEGTNHPLWDLYQTLDQCGAVDWFDWKGYADSVQEPLEGLHFVVIPNRGAFLFND